MFESFNLSLVDWSRVQFALTAMYHWLFVPLTLGLSVIIAIIETKYYKTGDETWKKLTKFWMKIFGVNFAIGVATGLILEFEFGTNWSNYSWFVGDIFGAPLAIEGIMAFFMETIFIAIMYFGWDKVSRRFHLLSTWLVALGANLSALWILVANAWMQNPVGMKFNPDTVRNEMINFWDVLFSPTAVGKFTHTVLSSFTLSAIFVVGVCAWYLIKNRHVTQSKRSMKIASIFGLISMILTIYTGDISARDVSKTQPMKFAAMEAHFHGSSSVPLKAVGIIGNVKESLKDKDKELNFYGIQLPGVLSYLTNYHFDSYVPGINDLLYGNNERGLLSVNEKIERGYLAKTNLLEYKKAVSNGDLDKIELLKADFENPAWINKYFNYFGYSSYYSENKIQQSKNAMKVVPPVSLTFYTFHIMVLLGMWFILLFILILILLKKKDNKQNESNTKEDSIQLRKYRWFLWAVLFTIPLSYIASESGWIVCEVGRQPWIIQDLMTTSQAVTHIETYPVMLTCCLFALIFTALLIADIKIIVKQIKIGMDDTPIDNKNNLKN
ncbi:MAG: cytochrome ubiquinol oxidase subunit I [Bacteroidales bacterium]